MTVLSVHSRLIGIQPTGRGFGFAIIEASGRLVYSGVARLSSNNDDEFVTRLEAMVDKYRPVLMAFEDTTGTKRSEKAKRRIDRAVGYSGLRDVRVSLLSRGELRKAVGLPSDATNHDVAIAMAAMFAELEQRLPAKRKPWQSDDERMAMFGALALSMAALAAISDSKPMSVDSLE